MKPVQRHNQDIWSNFRFLYKRNVFKKRKKQRCFTIAKPRNQSKSIGHWILLFIRGFNPHIDLLEGPNKKNFFILEFMKSSPCCL